MLRFCIRVTRKITFQLSRAERASTAPFALCLGRFYFRGYEPRSRTRHTAGNTLPRYTTYDAPIRLSFEKMEGNVRRLWKVHNGQVL